MSIKDPQHKYFPMYNKTMWALSYPAIKLHIDPSAITVLGTGLMFVAGILVWQGFLFMALILLIFGGFLDAVDGYVARTEKKATKVGALLDSTLDRYAEFALLVGIAMFFLQIGGSTAKIFVFITMLAIAGSFLVSYVRARTEGLGASCDGGFFQRPQRLVILGIGFASNELFELIPALLTKDLPANFPLKLTIALLALGTNWTALSRLFASSRALEKIDDNK